MSRAYSSPLRERRAAETREHVVEASARCFEELGWSGTTMTEIGRRAGVSPKTVHGVGTKAYLLVEAFRTRYVGRGGWQSVDDDPEIQAIFALTEREEVLDVATDWVATAHRRSAVLWFVLRTTARVEPLVAAEFESLSRLKRESYRRTARWLLRTGVVPADEVPDDQLDRFTALINLTMGAETYVQLVLDYGFTDAEYRSWLRAALPWVRPC